MTVEELLGRMAGLIEQYGPIIIVLYCVFAAVVLALVVTIFVFVLRQFHRINRDFDDFDRPHRGWRR
ncbi:hypothetical protein DFO58_3276 [Arthrobacter sp. AG1021]|uniref:hypothetical protein n=1 Tax=Arthrobacter sp. AG1021 TaxID=2183908 RepID=UPI000EB40B04|nr:hypothetical protein [Arthrobacter sp. AG1021]RKS16719.1 hypothetical protein DFO58_3276 [Arthrobacter sp. AG1021]